MYLYYLCKEEKKQAKGKQEEKEKSKISLSDTEVNGFNLNKGEEIKRKTNERNEKNRQAKKKET